MKPRLLIGALLLLAALPATAEEGPELNALGFPGDLSGSFGAEYRYFHEDALDPRQHGNNLAGSFQPEWYLDWDDRDQSFTLNLFGRIDENDEERSHFDVREAFYRHTSRNFEWRVGVRKVFWGVTESVHLVDIINQDDAVESTDAEDKLGQPMVNLAWITNHGTVDFFLLPYFRERTFPGEKGRLRPLLPVDQDDPIYESDDEQSHLDFALRYFNTFGLLDLGVYYFRGTDRDPRFSFRTDGFTVTGLPSGNPLNLPPQLNELLGPLLAPLLGTPSLDDVRISAVNPQLVPVYNQIDQVGLDAQYTTGPWLLKLETIYQHSDLEEYVAAVAGFEYTFYQVFGSDWDVGALAEYLYDERGSIPPEFQRAAERVAAGDSFTVAEAMRFAALQSASASPFQNDVFVGSRIAFNDVQDTQLLAGVIYDTETDALLWSVEASRRIAASFRINLEARILNNIPITDPLFGLRQDDFVELELEWFF